MICKRCGYEGKYIGPVCPECHEKINLSEAEIRDKLSELEEAVSRKNSEKATELLHMLADAGHTVSMRNYARALEKGDVIPRDFDKAMEYFLRAAEKNDSYSAYRYSALASRTSDAASRFWLIYSAILGCKEAYPKVAEMYVDFGKEENAHYFYHLAAESDDVESIVTMARRYYNGVGTEKSPEYAKWYMDKLTIPPIYAIKLAYKLRSVKAKEPPKTLLSSYRVILKELSENAELYGYDTALMKLSELLSEKGDKDALAIMGILMIEGRGCKKNIDEGIECLKRSAKLSCMRACNYLGDVYSQNAVVARDMDAAVEYYELAGELGSVTAYELLGDIYHDGILVDRDVAGAVDYYDLAAKDGSETAKRKSDKIKAERQGFYEDALAMQKESPKEAFRLFAIACAMGHVMATYRVADCFYRGLGTEKNRKQAYLWYKEAATLGADEAVFSLGLCYEYGIGTKLDFDRAKDTFIKADQNGDSRAHDEIIAMMERKLKKMARSFYSTAMRLMYQKKFKLSKNYLDLAAELNYPNAIYTIGCLYEFGIGVECDKDKAFELYEESYTLRFRDPRAKYKLIVLKMLKQGEHFVKKFE